MSFRKQTPCVYMHLNREDNQVFYIGMSRDNQTRPNYFGKHHSQKWLDYLENTLGGNKGLIKVVIKNCQTIVEAFELEQELIAKLQPMTNIQTIGVTYGNS